MNGIFGVPKSGPKRVIGAFFNAVLQQVLLGLNPAGGVLKNQQQIILFRSV
jgi:hypothetical protein